MNVGRHRVQMDWQQLPVVKGGKGFKFKVSAIHMSTRIKYSEILDDHTSRSLAGFIERAILRLPPFYVIFTDNHMSFTMKYTHHPKRKTQFTQTVEARKIAHALIARLTLKNLGGMESSRTFQPSQFFSLLDNEALFKRIRFNSEEERRYQLRLWEMYYNRERPHQGIHMKTPWQASLEQHFQRTVNITLS